MALTNISSEYFEQIKPNFQSQDAAARQSLRPAPSYSRSASPRAVIADTDAVHGLSYKHLSTQSGLLADRCSDNTFQQPENLAPHFTTLLSR